jgi:pimeloyl-ACP methyl ester carboxylesterase
MSRAAILPAPTSVESSSIVSDWTTLTNGRSFHFVTAGPEAAPALLFLHGYTDSWRSAELLIPYLSEHFRFFALDQRGHGESDRDFDRFSLDDFAADAADFIRHAIRRPVILVGHSLGSLAAQRVAAEHKELVTHLVLIGSADTAAGNPAPIALRQALEELGGDAIPQQFAWDFQASTVAKPLGPGQLEVFVGESLRLRPEVWRKAADGLLTDTKIVAGQIDAPTLLLWGELDGVFDADAQQRLTALLKRGRLIAYPEVGHAPNWEIPEAVARDIVAFARA